MLSILGFTTFCLILMILLIAAWFRPPVGVAAVLCLYGIKQWGMSTTSFFYQHSQVANYACFVIAAIALVRASLRRSCVLCRIPPTTQVILALLLYSLFSLTWTPDLAVSLQQWAAQGPYVVTVALLAPLLFTDFEDARTAFTWTALVATTVSLLALLFGKWGARGLVLFEDIHDWEANPLALSSMAGTVFVISALSLGRGNGLWRRVFAMACIPVALAVILRSGSRGQLIGSVVGVMAAMPIAFRMKDPRSIIGLLVAAVLIVALGSWGASFVEIDSSRWAGSDAGGAVAGRLDNAERLLAESTANPLTILFGLGNSSSFPVVGFYTHIAGLEVFAEEGIVGVAMYVMLILMAVRSIRRIARDQAMTETKRNSLAILTGLLIFEFILSQKQGSLLSSVYVFLYAIILARLEEPVGATATVPSAAETVEDRTPRFQNLMR